MSDINIRRAVLADRPIICGRQCVLHLESSVRNETELHNQIKDLPTDFPALFSDELFSAETTRYWVAEAITGTGSGTGPTIVGSIGLLDQTDEDANPVTHLNSFSVEHSYRGKGLGRRLLHTALLDCVQRGVTRVQLLTLGDVLEPAVRLYASAGFVVVREHNLSTYRGLDMAMDEVALLLFRSRHG